MVQIQEKCKEPGKHTGTSESMEQIKVQWIKLKQRHEKLREPEVKTRAIDRTWETCGIHLQKNRERCQE